MTAELLILLVILGVTFALFVSNRFRLDLVAVASLLALFATGLVDVDEALAGFSHPLVIMIAAILPMATALDNTGGMEMAADALFKFARGYGPYALIIAVFVLTSGLSQLVSNAATTVLAAPIALSAATAMGVNPDAVLITVAIAASTAFATPVASPVNTLVYNPGDYRFSGFARVGIPLQLLIMVATLIVVPLFFPF